MKIGIWMQMEMRHADGDGDGDGDGYANKGGDYRVTHVTSLRIMKT